MMEQDFFKDYVSHAAAAPRPRLRVLSSLLRRAGAREAAPLGADACPRPRPGARAGACAPSAPARRCLALTPRLRSAQGEANRYSIKEIIGKGSYGVVCSAVDNYTGEKVGRARQAGRPASRLAQCRPLPPA